MRGTQNDLFVGSSGAFLDLPWNPGEIIKQELHGKPLPDESTLNVAIWRDWFGAHVGPEIFANLDFAAKTMEWAILVFRPEDVRRRSGSRSLDVETVRDNVLFELGLFYGHLGMNRVFILEQRPPQKKKTALEKPSDISGIQSVPFHDEESLITALHRIRQLIADRLHKPFRRWVPAESLAIGYGDILRRFTEARFDHGRTLGQSEREFTVNVLVPVTSFDNLGVVEVGALFESVGYMEVSAQSVPKGRPSMWIAKKQENPDLPTKYYDVPTTLHTAKTVIGDFTKEIHGKSDAEKLVVSQARAFMHSVRGQNIDRVTVTPFRNRDAIREYLAGEALSRR